LAAEKVKVVVLTGGGASEGEGAALATAHRVPMDRLGLEGGDRPARECRGRLEVRVQRPVDLVLQDFQEQLPDVVACVEERDAGVCVWPVHVYCAV